MGFILYGPMIKTKP
ncbi:BnaA06g01720D [Brassica napus]|uniref:BnaA06g01720D protein n=1 Tax=Brassica napus TaxID=3708 RepID=A0A078IV58_BRANA|nr:BnaA06g01720D [Brassica napus]